jgi:hypothetical protein
MKCPECEEPCDELVEYDGYKMCPECKEYTSNDDAYNDHLREESLKHMCEEDWE